MPVQLVSTHKPMLLTDFVSTSNESRLPFPLWPDQARTGGSRINATMFNPSFDQAIYPEHPEHSTVPTWLSHFVCLFAFPATSRR